MKLDDPSCYPDLHILKALCVKIMHFEGHLPMFEVVAK